MSTVEKTGTPRALVYVGEEPLLSFKTTQLAWDYLRVLSMTADEKGEEWPYEVYIAFVVGRENGSVWVPQIGQIIKVDGELKNIRLFGDPYDEFCDEIIDNWRAIERGLKSNG